MSLKQNLIDGFANFASKLGVASGIMQNATYTQSTLSKNRIILENMYLTAWLPRRIVDVVAEDMTRAGIDVKGIEQDDELTSIQRALTTLGVWSAITDGLRWSRLYGGAICVIDMANADTTIPLRIEAVGKNQFLGIRVYDMWNCTQSLEKENGNPLYYTITETNERVHYSRVLRFTGAKVPKLQEPMYQGWSASVIEQVYDRLVPFDTVNAGATNLIDKAHVKMVKIKGLRSVLSQGGQAEANLIKMFDLMAQVERSAGMTILDKDDDITAQRYTFSGLQDMLIQFGQQLSGACRIPMVILYGQSPAGFSTGETDIRNYYDTIFSLQESDLRKPLQKVLMVVYQSVTGNPVPSTLDYDFKSLWQVKAGEKADLSTKITTNVIAAYESGLIDKPTAMRELKASADITGQFTNITDEAIAEAEEPLPTLPIEPQLEKENAQAI